MNSTLLKNRMASVPGTKSHLCACGKHSTLSMLATIAPKEFIQAERYCGAPD